MIKINSEKRFFSGLLLGTFLFSFAFLLPINARAQDAGGVITDPDPCLVNNSAGDAAIAAKTVIVAEAAALVSVPVFNATEVLQLGYIQSIVCATKKNTAAVKDKTVGKSFWGIPILFTSWDSILKVAMKVVVKKLTANTVEWINTGFNGNPMFVQNPGKFFGDTANGLAENFIDSADSPLQFLCAPFADKVKLSLTNSYFQSTTYNPTCTFTGIKGNLEDFYQKFSTGGWDAWFSMTQNPNNNPYDSYLNAKVELDSQIASALTIKEKQLSWGNGFLGVDKCDSGAITQADIDANKALEKSGNLLPQNNALRGKNVGDCTGNLRTVTPGTVVEDQLQKVLGQGVVDIGLARSFDDLVSALVGALAKKVFNSAEGLFSNDGKDYVSSGENDDFKARPKFDFTGSNPAEAVVCSADTERVIINNPVTWKATSAETPGITVSYSWRAEEVPSGSTGNTLVMNYTSPGEKTMLLDVIAVRDAIGGTPTSTQNAIIPCTGSVMVSQYQPLKLASCSVNPTRIQGRGSATWTANIIGGSGKINLVKWDGDDAGQYDGGDFHYNDKGPYVSPTPNSPQITFTATKDYYWLKGSGGGACSGVGQGLFGGVGSGCKYQDVARPGYKSAKISIVDADPTVAPLDSKNCSAQVYIYH